MKKVISLLLAAVMLVSMFAGLQIIPAAEAVPAAQPYEEATALPKESTLSKPEREEPLPDEALKELSVEKPSEAKPVLENCEADMAQADDISFSCEIPQSVSGDLMEAFWKYQLLEDNTAMITGCILPTIDMTIPNEIAGKKVTVIGEQAFQGNAGITSVTVSSGIEIIAANAFTDCTSLKKVTIPATVKETGYGVFSGCTQLKTAGPIGSGCNIEFGWDTAIPENAFGSCTSLEQITIPNGIKTIGGYAFYYCTSLQKVTIPATVKEMGYGVFSGCTQLKTAGAIGSGCDIEFGWNQEIPAYAFHKADLESIVIPGTITSIRDYAFGSCTSLKKVIIPATVKEMLGVFYECTQLKTAGPIGSGCNIEYSWKSEIPGFAFAYATYLERVEFPSEIKSIGKGAFMDSGLTEITLPKGIEIIDNQAFSFCRSLNKVVILENIDKWGASIFYGSNRLKTAGSIGSGCNIEFCWTDMIPAHAFQNCESLTDIELPGRIKSIGLSAFSGCKKLTKIVLPNGVTSIDGFAFGHCANLTKIIIPASVKEMGSYVFYECTQLKTAGAIGSDCDIEFGWNQEIPAYAFYQSNLESIIIPETITSIGDYAFVDCKYLNSVSIANSVKYIGESAFYRCESLQNINFPNSLTIIGESAFYRCELLQSINFSNSLTTIGGGAFKSCKSLKSIKLPASVEYIGSEAFMDCSSIVSAGPIGSGCDFEFAWTKILPPSAFDGLKNLKSVIFPEGLERIGDDAFSCCEGLGKLEVPETVVYIGNFAFYGCIGLSKVILKSTNPYLGGWLFTGCSQLKSAGPIGSGCDIEFGWKLISLSNSHVFAGMDSLKTLIIPEGTVDIDNQLIRDCNPDSLYLPNSLQYIFFCPFALGNSVKHIYYYGTENDLNNTNIRDAAPYLGSPKIHCLGKNPNSDGNEQGLPAYSFNCIEELAKYVDIAEFDKYLYESFKNRLEEIDISAFNIPYMALYRDLIEEYIDDYLSYKTELGEPWVWTMCEGKYGIFSTLSVWYFSDIVKESAEFQEKADVLLQGLKNNASLSDLQKALIVHDRLIKYLEYDFNAYNSGDTLAASNLEDIIISGKAVCSGYAAAYKYLLVQLNIQCSIVSSAELDHAWNIVYIENKPYYVDCTWDDYGGDIVSHSNFLRSDTGIEQTGHTAKDYAPAFSMHNTKYDNYAWQNIYSEI
ncbi:MAG: leucine-rich repeat protein, partial [Clostridia bacterium]|nr:leucine-rich repeat protein [Clostridia bacterium]